HGIQIQYIDATTDLAGVANNEILNNHIAKKFSDERSTSGTNGASFKVTIDNVVLRIKLYNKFVQMLESTSVRSTIGSQIANLV
ncbi:hypothetical protein BGZ83_003556, partial [Gryganskiella cystojenkinii]